MHDLSLWVMRHPLSLLGLTLGLFELTHAAYNARNKLLLLNPLIWSVGALVAFLLFFDVPLGAYQEATKPLKMMLGPTTVALAIPLYEQRKRVRRTLKALALSVVVGSVTGILLASCLMLVWTGEAQLALSAAPKSVTTPVAIVISERLGGLPALTAGLVLLTAIFGSACVPQLLKWLPDSFGVNTDAARGLGIGMSAHGLGTARAFQESDEMGIYASIAIGLNGFVTALLVPQLLPLLIRFLT